MKYLDKLRQVEIPVTGYKRSDLYKPENGRRLGTRCTMNLTENFYESHTVRDEFKEFTKGNMNPILSSMNFTGCPGDLSGRGRRDLD